MDASDALKALLFSTPRATASSDAQQALQALLARKPDPSPQPRQQTLADLLARPRVVPNRAPPPVDLIALLKEKAANASTPILKIMPEGSPYSGLTRSTLPIKPGAFAKIGQAGPKAKQKKGAGWELDPSKEPVVKISLQLIQEMEARGETFDPHPNSAYEQARIRCGVQESFELERILKVPRRPADLSTVVDQTELYKRPEGTMRLWPIQSAVLIEAALAGGLLGPVGVGHGKTLASLLVGAAMHARMIVLLVPPQLRTQLLQKDIPHLAKHWRLPLERLRVIAYSELSNARTDDLLDKLKPDLIVADECFPFETLIETEIGPVPIGEIVELGRGETALAYNRAKDLFEFRPIRRRLRKPLSKSLVAVHHERGMLVCTEDHKVLTKERGYVRAASLQAGDLLLQDLSLLRKDISVPFSRQQEGRPKNVLLSGMCSQDRGSPGADSATGNEMSCYQRTHDGEKPHAPGRDSSKNDREEEGQTLPNPSRRERTSDPPAMRACIEPTRQCDGVRRSDEGLSSGCHSDVLQNRRSDSSATAGDRVGRAESRGAFSTATGCEEGKGAGFSRVVRVEVLEPGSDRGFTASFRGDSVVYDLEVDEHHNYIASGVVVSNCHNLRHRSAARTKRFLRYMKEHPECGFVGLSGTLTRRSLNDYQHLAELALRKNSPLPNHHPTLQDWAMAIDVTKKDPMPPGALLKLCTDEELAAIAAAPSTHEAQVYVRQAFRRRVVETPGVVATEESALGTSLIVRGLRPLVPAQVQAAITELHAKWVIDDEELQDAMSVARVGRQLAGGFFYRWIWPDGVKDFEWLDARSAWNKEVRDILKRSRRGLDSPLLITNAIRRGEFESGTWDAWEKVKDRYKGGTPPTEAVWLSKFLVEEAVKWASACNKAEPGIIWYEWDAMGREIAKAGEFPFFGPGTKAAEEIARVNAQKTPVIVCSRPAHGTGKNLQQFCRNLFATPSPGGSDWEQTIARTHRPGQEADEVLVDVYMHTQDMEAAYVSALRDARYIEQTQGQKQKLLYARKVDCLEEEDL